MEKTIFIKNEDVIVHEEPDESLIYNDEDGKISIVNATGFRFIELCDGKNTFIDIVKTIANESQTSEEVIAKDMEEYVSKLISKNIIRKKITQE